MWVEKDYDLDKKDDIWILESSGKLAEWIDSFLSKFNAIRRNVLKLFWVTDEYKRKNEILMFILDNWFVDFDYFPEFEEYVKKWIITQKELKRSITVFLRPKSYEIFVYVLMIISLKWKIEIENELKRKDLEILCYGLKNKVINQIEQKSLWNSLSWKSLEDLISQYQQNDLVEQYLFKLQIPKFKR